MPATAMSTRHDDTRPLGVVVRIPGRACLGSEWRYFKNNVLKLLHNRRFKKRIRNPKRCTALLNEMTKRGLTVIDNDKT